MALICCPTRRRFSIQLKKKTPPDRRRGESKELTPAGCLAACLIGCLIIQIALRWGHPAICSVLPSEPWVNCHSSSALSPPVPPTPAPQTVAAMAMSAAPLPDDVWRGDVPGDASNASASPRGSWRAGSRHFVHEPFSWRRNRKKITELTVRLPLTPLTPTLALISTELQSVRVCCLCGGECGTRSPEARCGVCQSITTEKTREETLARARAAAAPSTESAPATTPVGTQSAAGSAGGGSTGLHWDAGGAWLADQWRPPEAAAGAQVPPPASAAAAGGAPSGKRLLRRRRRRRRSSKALCLELQRLHDVRPGLSWGSLPGGQREAWSTMKCDSLLHTGGGGGGAAGLAAASADTAGGRSPASSDRSDVSHATSTVAECSRVGRAHRVVSGDSWGSLPTDLRQWWASADCDRLLSGPRAGPPVQVQGAPDTLPQQRAEAP